MKEGHVHNAIDSSIMGSYYLRQKKTEYDVTRPRCRPKMRPKELKAKSMKYDEEMKV